MVFNILKKNNFRNLFFADIISGFGTGISLIGANWFLMALTKSVKSIGFMLAINVFAGLIIFPFVGILTDKFNRKSIIFWTNLIRAIGVFIIACTLLFSSFKIYFFYFFAVINGMGWSLYMAASKSLVQELLTKEDLIKGNSLIEISSQVGAFISAALSGIMYKYLGFWVILMFNTGAFVISNIFLFFINYNPISAEDNELSFYVQFKNGIRYLYQNVDIFLIGIISVIPCVATMTYNVVMPGYVNKILNGDSIVFGLADMFYGIGGFLSGFIAAMMAKKISRNGTIVLFYLISCGVMIAAALNNYLFILYVVSALFGLSNSSLRIVINTIIMETVPKSFMGRTMSVWTAISLLFQTASATGVGIMIDFFTARIGFIYISLTMILGIILWFFLLYKVKGKFSIEIGY